MSWTDGEDARMADYRGEPRVRRATGPRRGWLSTLKWAGPRRGPRVEQTTQRPKETRDADATR